MPTNLAALTLDTLRATVAEHLDDAIVSLVSDTVRYANGTQHTYLNHLVRIDHSVFDGGYLVVDRATFIDLF